MTSQQGEVGAQKGIWIQATTIGVGMLIRVERMIGVGEMIGVEGMIGVWRRPTWAGECYRRGRKA